MPAVLIACGSAFAAPFAYLTAQKENAVVMVDRASHARVVRISVGKSPVGIVVVDATERAYVTNADNGTVSVIDTVQRRVIDIHGARQGSATTLN